MFTHATLLLGPQAPVGQFENLFRVTAATVEGVAKSVTSTGHAQPASPFSSSLPASMFLALKSRLFKAGTVMPMTSAISA